VRALSLTQPWASAMAMGIKQWETRSWSTGFRGLVAIHAARGFPGWARAFALEQHYAGVGIPRPEDLPLGCIVAVGEIVDCRKTLSVVSELSQTEQLWGDYSDGRFAFGFKLLRVIEPCIPVRGSLGFWSIPDEIAKANRQLLGDC